MVLRDFLQMYSPTDLARIHYIQQQLLDIAETRHTSDQFDINQFLTTDLSMHRVWFQATDKLYLWDTLTKPQADYSRFIRLDIVGARNVPDVLEEHLELIDLIEEKDAAAIEPLLKRHLYGGVRRMGGQMCIRDSCSTLPCASLSTTKFGCASESALIVSGLIKTPKRLGLL